MRAEMFKRNVNWASIPTVDALLFYGVLLYLLTQVLDGPIRYGLSLLGLEGLLYLRDVILIAVIGVAIQTALLNMKANRAYIYVFLVLLFFTLIGLIYIPNVLQVLFGIKILFPFIAGLIWYGQFVRRLDDVYKYFSVFLWVACIGVLVNLEVVYPWLGLTYRMGGIQIEGGLDEITVGFARLTGFARSNFEAASQILLLGIFVVRFIKGRFAKFLSWLIIGAAIIVTTTKGIIVIYAVMSLFYISFFLFRNKFRLFQKSLILPMGVMIGFPLFIDRLDIDYSDPIDVGLWASLNDRLINAWPPIFQHVKEQGDILFGLGVGGAGSGEYYFSNVGYGTVDNFFVYLYAWFGLSSLLLYAWIYIRNLKLDINRSKLDFFIYSFLVCAMLYGSTSAILESPVFALFLGVALRHLATSLHGRA